MQINVRKLIADLVVTFTRDSKFIEFIRVLTSGAVEAYNDFNSNIADWKYKAKANASILSLQHHIKRELDVDVVITPMNGLPIDFLVSVFGFADTEMISQIIDTYGLAGRSYVYEAGTPIYSSFFLNYDCEISLIDNLVSFATPVQGEQLITVQLAIAVTIDITVVVRQVSQGHEEVFEWIIPAGSTTTAQLQFWEENQIMSVTPTADDTYRYTFDNTILTNQ